MLKLHKVRWFSRPWREITAIADNHSTRAVNAAMIDIIDDIPTISAHLYSVAFVRHNHRVTSSQHVLNIYAVYMVYGSSMYCMTFPNFPPRGTPANIRIYLIFLDTTITGLHFAADNIGLSSLKILFISARVKFRRWRSSKVIDFGTNRKRARDFLVVRHIIFDLVPFRRLQVFFVLLTPPLFHPNFGGVPVAPDHTCWGQCEQGPYAIRPWNYHFASPRSE